MEAIGAASSILALTIFAYDTSKTLYEAISSLQSQRKAVKEVQTDLASLVAVLGLVLKQAQGSEDGSRFEPLRQPVQCCNTTCQDMQEMLNKCTKHTKDNRDSVRDWLNMQYREKSFQDMKQRLASYKSTLSIAFASINIQDHATTQDSIIELRKLIEGTKDDLEDQLDQVRRAISGAGASLRDLLQADQAQLQSGLESLAQAQKIAETTQPQVVVMRNLAGQGSSALFGTDTSQPQFFLNVADNEAQPGAVMAAGVHSPETLQALLKRSQTADLVPILQALQNQPQSTYRTTVQSLPSGVATGQPQERTRGITDGPSTINNTPKLRVSDQEHMLRGGEILGRPTTAVYMDPRKDDEARR